VPQGKPYRLTPQPLPHAKKRRSMYDAAIEDFIASGVESALAEFGSRSAATVYAGLLHALKVGGRTDVVVRRREGRVYLLKAD
jgi:hypothetical protein